MGQASFSLGRLARDGKAGKWSWKKSNRKKGLFEFESDTKSQRAAKKSKQKSRQAAAAKARQKARDDARWRKAKDRTARERAFKARAEERYEQSEDQLVKLLRKVGGGAGEFVGSGAGKVRDWMSGGRSGDGDQNGGSSGSTGSGGASK